MPQDDLRRLLTGREGDTPPSRIIRVLAGLGPLSAAELSGRTGFARSTISMTLADLRRAGLVVETEVRSSGLGRPTLLHALNPEAGVCAGVLFGLGEIRVLLADVAHSILSETTIPLAPDYRPETARDALVGALDEMTSSLGLRREDLLGAGLAVSGPVAPGGRVMRGGILPVWGGLSLGEVFGAALRCPVFAENESHCAALAEMMWGAAEGERDFVLFKMDLGIGGALVIDGQVRTGADGSAAEFGHITIDPRGALCRCGNRGCLETVAGASTALRLAEDLAGRPVSLSDLVQGALAGHAGHRRLIEDAADLAGWGLGIVSTIVNPPLFVISGGMAAAGDLLLDRLRAAHERHALPKATNVADGAGPRFVVGRFLSNDTLLGAAGLVLRQHGEIR